MKFTSAIIALSVVAALVQAEVPLPGSVPAGVSQAVGTVAQALGLDGKPQIQTTATQPMSESAGTRKRAVIPEGALGLAKGLPGADGAKTLTDTVSGTTNALPANVGTDGTKTALRRRGVKADISAKIKAEIKAVLDVCADVVANVDVRVKLVADVVAKIKANLGIHVDADLKVKLEGKFSRTLSVHWVLVRSFCVARFPFS